MEIDGYKKGAVKAALENMLKRFVNLREANWKILKGSIKSELTSVELQHKIWKKVD